MRAGSVVVRLRPRRPSPAMVVAIIALVVACGGTAVAAGVFISRSSQIGRGVIVGNHIRSRAIEGRHIKLGSLGSDLLSNSTKRDLKSSGTGAIEWFRKAGPEAQGAGNPQRVITADEVPEGVYAIFSKTIVTDLEQPSYLLTPGHTANAHCRLSAGGDIDDGRVLIRTAYGSGPGDVSTQITHTFGGPGTINLDCDSAAHWRASDSTIIAIRLGNAPRRQVAG